jgi:flagellar basal-body rod protein FlgB
MEINLEILRMAQGMAAHASARQGIIAENIAHADTPGYQAKDLKSFAETYAAQTATPFQLKISREGHLPATQSPYEASEIYLTAFGAESPNGNNVSLEDQMMRASQIKGQHELALGIYRKSMDILRMSLGRR